jgi:hypothetical protein
MEEYRFTLENDPTHNLRVRVDKDHSGYVHGHYIEFCHSKFIGQIRGELRVTAQNPNNPNCKDLLNYTAIFVTEKGFEIPLTLIEAHTQWR